MGSRSCVAIGVSSPEGLTSLPGAVSAAVTMADWADSAGYERHLVVDVDRQGTRHDVTTDDLRLVFEKVFADGDIIDHLIIFFAGHGLSRDFRDQQWLLTRWRTYDEESVKLSAFVRKLKRYQPNRVSIIVDACRNIPGAKDDTNEGTGLLPTPLDEPREFSEDRFQATEFGESAYMLPGPQPICLFSNVMIAALAGALEGSTEVRADGEYVTSDTLDTAVTAAMNAQCIKWNLVQRPTLALGFRGKANAYAKLPLRFCPPPLAEPPAPNAEKRARKPLKAMGDRILIRRIDGEQTIKGGIIIPDTAKEKPQEGQVIAVGPGARDRSGQVKPLDVREGDRVLFGKWSGSEVKIGDEDLLIMKESDILGVLEGVPGDAWLTSGVKAPIDFENEVRPTHFETSTGMAVNGGEMKGTPVLPARLSGAADAPDHPDWWRFSDEYSALKPRAPGSLLFQLASGPWTGAAVFPGCIASFTLREAQTIGLVYRAVHQGGEPDAMLAAKDASEQLTQNLINRMLSGSLTNDDRLEAAANVRRMKHVDPVLGVIAAYLYDAVGDRDSIRRMAWFYADADQPIPYDIALLADLRGARGPDGLIRVDLPAVSARSDLGDGPEAARPELFGDTYPREAVEVAGGFPWLRQGWGILEAATLPVESALLNIAKGVAPAPFTTLSADAGQELANLILSGRV